MFREEIETTFGHQALELGLFYKVEYALCFELSLGGSYINQFSTAFDKERTVLARAFEGAERFVFIISYFGADSFISNLSVFRSLKSCDISVSRPFECWSINEQNERTLPSERRTLIASEGTREQITPALWGVLAADLGVKPKLLCRLCISQRPTLASLLILMMTGAWTLLAQIYLA